MPICRTCGHSFGTKRVKAGYIDQCDSCSLKTGDLKTKYIGRQGAVSKSANIEIFRKNLETVRQVVRRENVVGMTANLNLPSAAQHAAMEKFKSGEED